MLIRRLGLSAGLAAALAVSASALQAGLQETFSRGVQALRRGNAEEAQRAFAEVLAADLSQEQAFELWRSTDDQIWLDLLAQRGQMGQFAEHMLERARLWRESRRSDEGAIRELLAKIDGGDPVERRSATWRLAYDHGQYAVPYLVNWLADSGSGERRVAGLTTLTEMAGEAVPALLAALHAEDAGMRRQVALALALIKDRRAAPWLALAAEKDADEAVRSAAAQAAAACGGGDAYDGFLAQGAAYHAGSPSALPPGTSQGTVWSWSDGALAGVDMPAWLVREELAKACFRHALVARPDGARAWAGLARVQAAEAVQLEERQLYGEDLAAHEATIQQGTLAIFAAGPAALDLALAEALDEGDELAAIGLCRGLGATASAPTAGLSRALTAESGMVQTAAALGLAQIALTSHAAADAAVVAELAESAGRDVTRVGAVIDARGERAAAVADALEAKGVTAAIYGSGAAALAALRRLPGQDVIVLADELPDVLPLSVLDALRDDARYAVTPVAVVAADADAAGELFGDRVTAVVGADLDLGALDEALAGKLSGDRARAADQARRAAHALADLAMGGTSMQAGGPGLLRGLERGLEIAVPLCHALAAGGTPEHLPALAAIAGDGAADEQLRGAAAGAMAGIFGRYRGATDEAIVALAKLAHAADSPAGVREACAKALGRVNLTPTQRAALLSRAHGG
jgi:CheY-like chemotaxis protein